MTKVEAIIRPEKLNEVKDGLAAAGFVGLNIVQVTGRGVQRGVVHTGRGADIYAVDMLPKIKLELVVRDQDVEAVVDIILRNARTGNIGDGKVFLLPVTDAIRVRTGERGEAVLNHRNAAAASSARPTGRHPDE